MKKILILFFIALATVFTACEKALFEPAKASRDPLTNFDYLWSEVDKKYSYFELKKINWDQIKTKYRSTLSANSSEQDLFKTMGDMLNELRDDHTNLTSPFNLSRYNIALRGPQNFNRYTVEKYYVPNAWLTGPFIHDFISNNEIGYIRYESFMSPISDQELDLMIRRYQNTKGIILDLRSNGGGDILNIPKILSRFIQTKTLVGYFITRNGPNRNSFGEREDFFLTPYAGIKYNKPVAVLTDRGSYSATSFFSLATKALPNVMLVGDTTGGGGGLPNGGQLPNGWTYRFSVSQTLDINGKNYAEDGVPPDYLASFNWADITKDPIIERAIQLLK